MAGSRRRRRDELHPYDSWTVQPSASGVRDTARGSRPQLRGARPGRSGGAARNGRDRTRRGRASGGYGGGCAVRPESAPDRARRPRLGAVDDGRLAQADGVV